MVTVVPTLNRGASLAQAFGGGAQAAMNNPLITQKYQRGLLQEALDEAQQVFNDPRASPTDKLFAYKKAHAGLQGMGDRQEASLTPFLMQAASGNQAARNAPNLYRGQQQASPSQQFPENGGESSQQRSMMGMQQQNSLQDQGLNAPTEKGLGLPRHHSPEEISQAARQDLLRGAVDLPQAKLMERENAYIDAEQARQNLAAKEHADISKLRTEAQSSFLDFARERNPVLKDPSNEKVFNEIDAQPMFKNISDPTKRFNAVNDVFNQYKLTEKNISETGKRADFQPERYNQNINSLKTTVKPLLEKGQRGLAERILAENGYGRVEIARITNDLTPEQKGTISKAPSAERYQKEKDAFDSVEQYYAPSKKASEEKRLALEKDKFLNKWSETLKDTIKPGGQSKKNSLVFNPGTDLLLVRDDFMKKGGSSTDFNNMVLNLIDKEEIELDSYQQSQLPLLNLPPRSLMGISQIFWNGIPGYIERQ